VVITIFETTTPHGTIADKMNAGKISHEMAVVKAHEKFAKLLAF